ncbi:hypothetical protein FQB35_02165 [Crassaminicella thermophila]|uniref:DUF5673 domain-containing protein n=1 Tax=Crassaminicella thermophila TaxID=2599308 RepID=A0A5C0SCU1_CRATE|nr:hypothetical protein [Crassaminicella thermophila]QEK11268.1 hypothetical protein FQB35_02165 [Crassaminicella thermophila]
MNEILFYVIVILLILYIIMQQVKRLKIKDKVIVKSLNVSYSNLFLGAMFLVLVILNFKTGLSYFNDAYSLLIPKYLNSWHCLFNYTDLTNLEKKFLANKMRDEYWTVHMYIRFVYYKIFIVVTQLLLGIAHLLKGIENDIIYQDGIYTKRGRYTWDRIISYRWGEAQSNKIKKRNIEYCNLIFSLNNTNANKWFYWEGDREISIEINVEDRGKLEEFLKQAIKNIDY